MVLEMRGNQGGCDASKIKKVNIERREQSAESNIALIMLDQEEGLIFGFGNVEFITDLNNRNSLWRERNFFGMLFHRALGEKKIKVEVIDKNTEISITGKKKSQNLKILVPSREILKYICFI